MQVQENVGSPPPIKQTQPATREGPLGRRRMADVDWTKIPDRKERLKVQWRLAQRQFRDYSPSPQMFQVSCSNRCKIGKRNKEVIESLRQQVAQAEARPPSPNAHDSGVMDSEILPYSYSSVQHEIPMEPANEHVTPWSPDCYFSQLLEQSPLPPQSCVYLTDCPEADREYSWPPLLTGESTAKYLRLFAAGAIGKLIGKIPAQRLRSTPFFQASGTPTIAFLQTNQAR